MQINVLKFASSPHRIQNLCRVFCPTIPKLNLEDRRNDDTPTLIELRG